jgi:SAM-dependent methyltransferase
MQDGLAVLGQEPVETDGAISCLCNLCGNVLTKRFARVRDPGTSESFAIYQCPRCGLGHTIPQPENLDYYYGEAYHGGRHGPTAIYCAGRRLRIVKSAFRDEASRSLLDVGCGDGTFLIAARNRGWTVRGIEIKPDIARSAGLEVHETADQIPDGTTFDCITLWHSLEHLRDPRATITRLVGLLRKDGALVIAVPDAAGLQARVFGPNWFHLDVPRHLYHFCSDSIAYLAESVGFEVERKLHQELEYDLLGWSQSALNLIMPVPNSFFRALTGRSRDVGSAAGVAAFVFGGLLTAMALPAVMAGTISRRGGTLVTIARRKQSSKDSE